MSSILRHVFTILDILDPYYKPIKYCRDIVSD